MIRRLFLALALLGGLQFAPAAVRAAEHEPAAQTSAAEEGGEKGGLLNPDVNTAIWVLVIFIVLLIILYPTAWKNVLAGLKKREERIRKDIADAEAARAKAEATLRQYNEQLAAAEGRVREMLSKATQDGERLATQIRAQAQKEAEDIRERNAKDIEAAKDAAIREIHESAVDLSTRIAEKILKRNLNADDQRELVRSSLEQLSSVAKN